jgi:hypothetical protein
MVNGMVDIHHHDLEAFTGKDRQREKARGGPEQPWRFWGWAILLMSLALWLIIAAAARFLWHALG